LVAEERIRRWRAAFKGNYKPKTDYLIVDNDGTDPVTGKFAKVTTNLAFLKPTARRQAPECPERRRALGCSRRSRCN
jgi:hypothetical protein